MKDPANIVYYMRKRLNLTQEELSVAAKLTKNDISRMERGIFTHEISKFIQLSKFFNIPIDSMLFNDLRLAFPTFIEPAVKSHKLLTRMKQINDKNTDIGLKGEEWVYAQERKKLKGTAFEYAVNPNYSNDPEAGFDILSFSKDGESVIIEVKTTTGGVEDVFFFSASELEKAQECLKNSHKYELHRVYHINDPKKCSRKIISADRLFRDYEFVPEIYRAIRRKER